MRKDVGCLNEAADGLEALDVIRKQPPAVVVMDVSMPRLHG